MTQFYKQKPDWEAIAAEVSVRLGRDITPSLCVNVAHGWTKSRDVMAVILKIAPDAIKKTSPVVRQKPSDMRTDGLDSGLGADGVYRIGGDISPEMTYGDKPLKIHKIKRHTAGDVQL